MQLIAVDIGNSSTKVAVETKTDDRWRMQTVFRGDDPINLGLVAPDIADQPAFWSASSVNSVREEKLRIWITKHRPNDHFHSIAESDVPLNSNVESREQLGRDRLVAAWMATELNDQSGPIIVVDAGTAVTIDLVCDKLIFQGGHIFPGAELSFRQLSQDTDALPDLSNEKRSNRFEDLSYGEVGKSTNAAILQGVYQSQIGAITGIVAAMSRQQNSQPVVYTTGGGIKDIGEWLPESWLRVPDLVLQGARKIGKTLMT